MSVCVYMHTIYIICTCRCMYAYIYTHTRLLFVGWSNNRLDDLRFKFRLKENTRFHMSSEIQTMQMKQQYVVWISETQVVEMIVKPLHKWCRCLWKKHSFRASLDCATQRQRLLSGPRCGSLKAYLPKSCLLRRSVFPTDTGIMRCAMLSRAMRRCFRRSFVKTWTDQPCDIYIYIYIYIYTHTYVYIYVLCVCLCICVCVHLYMCLMTPSSLKV